MKTVHDKIEELLVAVPLCFFGQINIHQIIEEHLRKQKDCLRGAARSARLLVTQEIAGSNPVEGA